MHTDGRLSNATFTSLCEEFQKNNRIDPAKFEQYDVKRGLRNADGSGVMAGPMEGPRLFYTKQQSGSPQERKQST